MKIYLQKSASIQPRTSHLIFILLAASRDLIFTELSSPIEVLWDAPMRCYAVAFVDAEDDEGLQRGARALVAALLRAADAPGLFVRWECEIVGLHTMFIRTPSENGFF